MPRTARAAIGGICYHVINRGNGRSRVFRDDADYEAFRDLFAPACERLSIRVLGYCFMPNHFHLVLWPRHDGDLSRWMQWLLTSHVRRHHRRHRGSGHIWQGRFKAFPIQQDLHLLTVLRYVERNPLRARLVGRAEDWQWSSLHDIAARRRPEWLVDGPVDRPRGWTERVNQAETAAELSAVRRSVVRGTPFGMKAWIRRAATRLGLESTLNPRGRPRNEPEK
ncbi:MAG: transposase [Planctomycetes bacterium]|nr:transposase [Planctomycetota bacterium]